MASGKPVVGGGDVHMMFHQLSQEALKTLLDDAGFIHTEIHRMKPSNATIIGVKA